MNNKLFKYHPQQRLGDEPIVIFVTDSMIQQFAEDNFDRRLTEVELNRVSSVFFEHDHELSNLMHACVADALDTDIDWSYTENQPSENPPKD